MLHLDAPANLVRGLDAQPLIGALQNRHEDLRRIRVRRASALRGVPRPTLLRKQRRATQDQHQKARGRCRIALR